MKLYFDYTDSSREEWLQARRGGIGASEIAAVLSASDYSTPYSVWLDKTGQTPLSDSPTFLMRIGNALEPLIGELCAEEYGGRLETPRCIYQHDDYPHMLCTPDHFLWLPGEDAEIRNVIECKTSGHLKAWEDGPPLMYQYQAMHQLAVTGDERAIIAMVPFTLYGAGDPVYHIVHRDERVIEILCEAVEMYWEKYIDGGEKPPITAADNSLAVRYCQQIEGGGALIRDNDIDFVLREYETAKAEEKAAKEAVEHYKSIIMNAMADAQIGVTPTKRVKFSVWDVDTFDEKAFKEEHPDLHAHYRKTHKSHRITVKDISALKGAELRHAQALLEEGEESNAE